MKLSDHSKVLKYSYSHNLDSLMNIDWTIAPALVQKCFQTNWRICKILQKKIIIAYLNIQGSQLQLRSIKV